MITSLFQEICLINDIQYEMMLDIVNRSKHDNVMPGVKL